MKSRRMRGAGHVARMGEERGVYRVLVGKPEERRPMGRPRRRWVDNIRMNVGIWTGLSWARIQCKLRRGVYKVLLGKPEGKRPLRRPRRRWVDIRMDLQEVGCGYMDWIGLAQDRDRWRTLVSAVMNLRVP